MDAADFPEKSETKSTNASAGTPEEVRPVVDSDELYERIVDMIRTIYDPEIPVNIYEIGLIYSIDISPSYEVHIRMTLTSPACPSAGTLPGEVEDKVRGMEGVNSVRVEVVWDPVWTPAMMSEAAKLQLGMF
ncbi:MAG: SUF system Fe-S cluster assembly protein [Terriglobia bacterium]